MTDFVKALLEVYWGDLKMSIFWKIFIPYIIYLSLTIWYIMKVICVEETEIKGKSDIYIGVFMLANVAYQLNNERIQIKSQKKYWDYFGSIINLADLAQYGVNIILIVTTVFEKKWPSKEHRIIMAAFLVFLVWTKMFDWLRMFDTTSFYIKLIVETIKAVLYFLIVFPVFLAMFGCSMYILDMNREGVDHYVNSNVGRGLVDVLID